MQEMNLRGAMGWERVRSLGWEPGVCGDPCGS